MQHQPSATESGGREAARGNLLPIIHIVDDDESIRKALSRLLSAAGYVVQTHATAAEFLHASIGDTPGCALLDIRMPGTNGLDLQETLTRHNVQLPVIFLTGHGNIPLSVRAMKAGAVDFLTKPVKRETLLEAIQIALTRDAKQRAINEQMRKWNALLDGLTTREREVFGHVVTGRLNKQIASDLAITLRTVKAHRAKVMEKMEVESLAELVHIADELHVRSAIPSPRPHA